MSDEHTKPALSDAERLEGLLVALGGRIDDAHQETKGWCHNIRNSLIDTNHELSKLKDRLATAENRLNRHDSGFVRASDADLKHESDIAAVIIATTDCKKAIGALQGQLATYQADQATKASSMVTMATQAQAQTVTLDKRERKSTLALVLTTFILLLQIALQYMRST